MEQLLMDMIEEPEFVHALLTKIADYNIAQVREALKYVAFIESAKSQPEA